jgi:hypothetical protein
MSRRHQRYPAWHSYRELIATVQESAADLVEHQMTRDRERFSYEKQKLVLLILMFLSLWIMFFLLWEKLDDFRPDNAPPAVERNSTPDPTTLPGHPFEEPVAIHYVL